jgi:hypothetical protein
MRLFMTHEQVAAGVPTRSPKQHREHQTAQRFGGALVWVFLFFATLFLGAGVGKLIGKTLQRDA